MMDAELREWWPEFGNLVEELRRTDRTAVADRLVGAVRAGATSSEILGLIGIVLREHGGLRPQLSDSAKSAWDAVMADVNRPYPLRRLAGWLHRLVGR